MGHLISNKLRRNKGEKKGIGVALGLLSVGINVVNGVIANKKANDTANDSTALLDNLNNFERQPIENPYSGSSAFQFEDNSGEFSNPYANLKVATQAAEIQMEQTDLALAATLDTLQATGASAGGATALANAAARSKKDVAANIEQQEAQNEKLRAQGEQQLNQQKMAEAQRIQGAEAAGKEFVYGQQENRELMQLDRAQNQADNAAAQEAQSRADMMGALTGAIGGIASTAGSAYAAGAFDKKPSSGSGINKAYDPIDLSFIEKTTGKKIGD